jgi:putative RNA 2'-phosphotransferase
MPTPESRRVRISKFLSLVLRHKPETIGIRLDPHGWVPVAELLGQAARHAFPIAPDELREVVETNDKRRFALSDDGLRIRASQGHSIAVDLQLEPATPPDVLYHGTVARFLPAIRREGLRRQRRQYVHLSADGETAMRVGGRRGEAVVLEIEALRMREAGLVFYRSANGVWLTDHVPPDFIRTRAD